MKKDRLFWGIAIIAAAVLIIIESIGSGLGFLADVPIIRIILGLLCLTWAITSIINKKFPEIFFPLAFVFILFEGEIAKFFDAPSQNIMSNWLVLLTALLLSIGTSFLYSPPKKPNPYTNPEQCRGRVMGNSAKYIDCNGFTYQLIINKLGSCDIYFENIGSYIGDAVLELENDLGATAVHVPAEWHIKSSLINNLGSVSMPSSGNVNGPVIEIRGNNHLGSVSIISE